MRGRYLDADSSRDNLICVSVNRCPIIACSRSTLARLSPTFYGLFRLLANRRRAAEAGLRCPSSKVRETHGCDYNRAVSIRVQTLIDSSSPDAQVRVI